MRKTEVRRVIRAPRAAVYRALLDPAAVQRWMVPEGMTSEVHAFEPRVGGTFRISPQTDTHHGRFVELVADTRVVQVVEFETDDPAMKGEMTIRYELRDVPGGTEVIGVHENVPPGVSLEDNDTGWRMSLENLARVVEEADR